MCRGWVRGDVRGIQELLRKWSSSSLSSLRLTLIPILFFAYCCSSKADGFSRSSQKSTVGQKNAPQTIRSFHSLASDPSSLFSPPDLPHKPLIVPAKLLHLPENRLVPVGPLPALGTQERLEKQLHPLVVRERRRLLERTSSVRETAVAEGGVQADGAGKVEAAREEDGLGEGGEGGRRRCWGRRRGDEGARGRRERRLREG